MKGLKIAGSLFGAYVIANWAVKQWMLRNACNCAAKLTDARTVSIVLPTYNEQGLVKRCLDSLMEQTFIKAYPEYCEIIIVDSSTDATPQIVGEWIASIGEFTNTPPVVKIFQVPHKGKLVARDIGNRKARGDIIVAIDGDRSYPCNWLNLMVSTFNGKTYVAGVTGVRIFEGALPALMPIDTGAMSRAFKPWMDGGNSAFLREAYLENPFSLTINYASWKEVWLEEECRFAENIGVVAKNYQAVCYSSSRRALPWVDQQFTQEIATGERMARLGHLI